MPTLRTPLTTLIAALLLCAGCAGEDPEANLAREQQAFEERPVAAVGEAVIRTEELQRNLTELPPFLRRSIRGETGLRSFRKGMIEFELLLGKAREAGFEADPDVLVATREGLAAQLWQELDAEVGVPDDEAVRAYFEAHREDYLTPERVTVDWLQRRELGAAQRNLSVFHTTLRLNALFGAPILDPRALFLELASRARPNRTPTLESIARRDAELVAPRRVVEAAFELSEPGSISEPIITHEGVHLLRLVRREARQQRDFEAVRSEVRADALEARRVEHRREVVRKLRAQTPVEILKPPTSP